MASISVVVDPELAKNRCSELLHRAARKLAPGGGILPEMPTQLVGSKYDRVCRAMAFAQRAEALYEKARNLIVVEAEGTFFASTPRVERTLWLAPGQATAEPPKSR